MKFQLFLIFLFMFSACREEPSASELKAKEPIAVAAAQEQLRYLKEIEWPKAYREQDTVLLDRILGDDFKMVRANGEWSDKAKELAWIKENAMTHDSFRFEIRRLEVFNNGTAIVGGTGHIINDGKETTYESSNVLILRDGIWKAVLSHVSGIKAQD